MMRTHPRVGLASLAVAAVALLGIFLTAAQSSEAKGPGPPSLPIDGIAPTCVVAGDEVTVEGSGFGAHNVDITVGGLPAELVQREDARPTGHSATFIVPDGLPLGPAEVVVVNPGGRTGTTELTICDLRLLAAWEGAWLITVASRDAKTDQLLMVAEYSQSVPQGTTVGLDVLQDLGDCSGSVDGAGYEVECSLHIETSGCSADVEVRATGEVTGDTLGGAGGWDIAYSGLCGLLASDGGQTFTITGERLSDDPGDEPSTLRELLDLTPLLMELIESAEGGE